MLILTFRAYSYRIWKFFKIRFNIPSLSNFWHFSIEVVSSLSNWSIMVFIIGNFHNNILLEIAIYPTTLLQVKGTKKAYLVT